MCDNLPIFAATPTASTAPDNVGTAYRYARVRTARIFAKRGSVQGKPTADAFPVMVSRDHAKHAA